MDLQYIKDLINGGDVAFTEYEPGYEPGYKKVKRDCIHIGDKSSSLSKNLIEAMNGLEFVKVSYNEQYQLLKMVPTADKAVRIGVTGQITARGFLAELDIKARGDFPAMWDEQDQCIYAILK